MKLFRKIPIILALLTGFSLFAQSDKTKNKKELYLKDVADFPIGVAMSLKAIHAHPLSCDIFNNEFNSLTPEYQMKMTTTQPQKDRFDFSLGDQLVDYAEKNNKRVHGHVLIYPMNSYPKWLEEMIATGDSVEWENIMKTRIQTMVKHYKGRVKSWDVVAEALWDNGTIRKYPNDQGKKGNIWSQKLGDDYIARAFIYAHEANPDALLFYNDYGHEYSPRKLDAILELVENLKKRGVPIHGVGLQFHTHVDKSKTDVEEAISAMASTGLLVHISELTMKINRKKEYTEPTVELLERQGAKYQEIVECMKLIPPEQRFGLTVWNMSDGYTHIKNDWPLLWDKNYERKPAYYGVLDGLKVLHGKE